MIVKWTENTSLPKPDRTRERREEGGWEEWEHHRRPKSVLQNRWHGSLCTSKTASCLRKSPLTDTWQPNTSQHRLARMTTKLVEALVEALSTVLSSQQYNATSASSFSCTCYVTILFTRWNAKPAAAKWLDMPCNNLGERDKGQGETGKEEGGGSLCF